MKTVRGDLIALAQEGEFDIIVHGCNCFHTMGAGIALQLARKFPGPTGPEAIDKNLTEMGDPDKLGSITIAMGNNYGGGMFAIVNGYTQFGMGKDLDGNPPVNYDAIRSVFKAVAQLADPAKSRIGYPAIGAGLAGGDWDRISTIIDEELTGFDHVFVEYVPYMTEAQTTAAVLREAISADIFYDPSQWATCEEEDVQAEREEAYITTVVEAMQTAVRLLETIE